MVEYEKLEFNKAINRSRKSKENRQYDGQKKQTTKGQTMKN